MESIWYSVGIVFRIDLESILFACSTTSPPRLHTIGSARYDGGRTSSITDLMPIDSTRIDVILIHFS